MPLQLLAACAGASGLFSYNRENYFFDKQQNIKLEYQAQEMRIRQFELYREDVRDLVDLTIAKMEKYLIVNTLLLGFCFTLFSEGRPKPGVQPWLASLFCLCNAGAFLYYLLSMWLAMHASVSAHAFGVRLLTQAVRLPLPSEATLDRARALAQGYEGLRARDLLRLPLWRQQLRRLEAAMEDRAATAANEAGPPDTPGLQEVGSAEVSGEAEAEGDEPGPLTSVARMEHVQLFRKLQANWQSYDAYARVCMAMGTNQLLHTLSYCTLGLLVHRNRVPIPALSCVVIFTAGAFVLGKLDLYLSRNILTVAAALLVTPPVLTMVCMVLLKSWPKAFSTVHDILLPVVFLLHVVWISFSVFVARASSFRGVSLPTKFRSVLFLDVFGWLAEDDEVRSPQEQEPSREPAAQSTLASVAENRPAPGPGSSSICEEAECGSMPESIQPVVLASCQELLAQVQGDLRRWGSPEVSQLLGVGSAAHKELRRLRRLSAAIVAELEAVAGFRVGLAREDLAAEAEATAEGRAGDASTEASAELPVYLQLEWDPEGDTMSYYYQCETGETLWEPPAERARISEVQSLERDIGELYGKARVLLRCTPRMPAATRTPSSSPEEQGAPADAPEARAGPGPAGRQATAEGECAHLPGQLPWRVVLYGSQVLVAVWLLAGLGLCLSLLGIINFSYEPSRGNRGSSTVSDLDQPLQLQSPIASAPLAEQWPHRFHRPLGLACSPGLGTTVLLAERYAVHEIRINSTDQAQLQRIRTQSLSLLDPCLVSARRAWGAGVKDLDLECSASSASNSSCSALLLAADGRRAVRCPLLASGASASASASASAPSLRKTWMRLHGGPWTSLAASGRDSFWALGAEGIPTLLLPEGGEDWFPASDLRGRLPSSVALHLLGNHTLLSLESCGRLHAQPLMGGPPSTWSLPSLRETVSWLGVCSTGDRLFLLGSNGRPEMSRGLWHVELPVNLAPAV